MIEVTRFITGPIDVNTYIVPVTENSVFIIDPAGSVEDVCKWIASRNLVVRGIVLTHGHFDHILALAKIKLIFPAAFVMIHSADAQRLGSGGIKFHQIDLQNLGLNELLDYVRELPDADVFLADGDEPFKNWKVIHTPGHTPGSICLYNEKEKVLLSGDTLFDGAYGRTDLAGGDLASMQKSIAHLASLPSDTKVFPGHGNFTFIESIQ